jgi:hypothetical protein
VSNQLSIAAATATLRYILHPAMDIVPGAQVTTVRPDHLGKSKLTKGVNVYLYRITPNTSFRNVDVPTRRGDGSVSSKPTQVVDLHFLVSAYGEETNLEAQLLMGACIARMHERTILNSRVIEEAIDAQSSVVDGCDLDEQKPRIRAILEPMSNEELARIWGVLYQVPYHLTVTYRVGPIFLESDSDVAPRERVSEVSFDYTDMDDQG